ncbi:hypothetical protein GMDG_06582 [Pseudogymnoascus destructans 20631-21]|uniref:Uncharacterized protein n=1 Tax=Pseudogymnoascus destructans (strain ATCC MYA-4855 / 20631-21) TaxID=658429 RepID=L8FSZ4_PSED2|nr:hypothetical protein GMDG_06582 [Pseudogymnoascus destructans 20631-21]
MAKLLLDHGALVGAHYGEDGFRSLLHHAAVFGVVATVELLMSHGAEVNEQDERGQACLHLVLNHLDPGMMKLLLGHGALGRLNKEDLLLLKQGVEIKVQDDPEGNSNKYELEWRREDLANAKLLLDYGSDFNILDNKGKSALDYAAENKGALAPTLNSS